MRGMDIRPSGIYVPANLVAGDLIYGVSGNVGARLAVGNDGEALAVRNGAPIWTPPRSGLINPIMNSTYNIWQAGNSFTSIASNTPHADGWNYFKGGTGAVHDLSRSTDVPAVSVTSGLANYSLLLDCTTADAAMDGADFIILSTTIEGYDWLPFAQRTISLSFWVKATKTGIYCVALRNAGANRSYIMEYTVNASDVWEYKTLEAITASPSAGTWDYTTGSGLSVFWTLMCGVNAQDVANTWVSANRLATANQVNGVDNTANNWRLYGANMVLGSYAAPVMPMPYPMMLQRAQRYFCKTFPIETAPAQNTGSALGALVYRAGVAGVSNQGLRWQYPVRMRAAPTVTLYNPSATNSNWRNVTDGADSGASSTDQLGESSVFVTNAQAAGDAAGELLAVHAAASARI